nr:MAG TPA: hypothetical protein [Caudoviricetes sp.]
MREERGRNLVRIKFKQSKIKNQFLKGGSNAKWRI